MPPKRTASSSATTSSRTKRARASAAAAEPLVVTCGKGVLAHAASLTSDTPSDAESDSGTPPPPELTLTSTQAHDLVAYARHLEVQLSAASGELSADELETEVSKLRGLVARGIEKLMKWKPSCKNNSAAYSFEGICANPKIIEAMVGAQGGKSFKAKK